MTGKSNGDLGQARLPVSAVSALRQESDYGVFRSSIEGRFLEVSPTLVRILGYQSEAELLALDLARDVYFEPTARSQLIANAHTRISVAELVWKQKNGRPLIVRVSAYAIRDDQNRVVGFEGYVEDITAEKQMEESLRQERSMLEQLLEMHEQERQLTAYEIHDGLTQQLAGAILQMQAYCRRLTEKPNEAQKEFDRGMALLAQSMAEARRLISGLRPPILDESGVVAAIEHLVWEIRSQCDLDIEFHADVEFDRLTPPLETTIYRVVHEGLTNACRHSKSTQVVVHIVQQGEGLCLEIRDWGVGFDQNGITAGRGLQQILQRVRIFRGHLDIQSLPGKGTCIAVELPLIEAIVREEDSKSTWKP